MTNRAQFSTKPRKGIAIVMTALMLVIIVPCAGLAIDAGVLYTVKAKLQTATDAAAIAAARSLNVGISIAEQEASASARARAFFHANFPDGLLDTGAKNVQIQVAETGFRTRTVTVSGDVQAPVYFMRVLGFRGTAVRASGQASRRDVNLIMVLDRSGSMNNTNSCEPMKQAVGMFANLFANGRDRLGMITFGASYFRAYPPTMNFRSNNPSLADVAATIVCGGATSSAMAISEAQNEIAAINEPGALNVILFFTDGHPNGITASFEIKKRTDTRFGYGADGFTGTATSYSIPPSTCHFMNTAFSSTVAQRYNLDNNNNSYSAPNWNPRWTPIPNKLGVIAGAGNGTASTGATWGLYIHQATSISASETFIPGSTGCSYATAMNYVRRDIAYIPNTDYYGNATNTGPWSSGLAYFTSGDYNNRIRPDRPSVIGAASKNAAYHAAAKARKSIYGTVFYTIGLGNTIGADAADDDFMRRITNSPDSPEYDPNQPEGLYVFAPNAGQLSAAFYRIASEVLRISQ